jgi:hypothetical protein
MRKILLTLCLLFALAGTAFAQGTSALTESKFNVLGLKDVIVMHYVWTADGSHNAPAAYTLSSTIFGFEIQGYRLAGAESWAGSLAPTSSYTLTVASAAANTIMTVTGEGYTECGYNLPMTGDLTLTVASNLVNSAVGHVDLVFTAGNYSNTSIASYTFTGTIGAVTEGSPPWTWSPYVNYDSTVTALPNTLTALTATTTWVNVLFCNNTDSSSHTLTVTDTAGHAYASALSISGNTNKVVFESTPGIKMVGIKWNADASSVLVCQVEGRQ